MKIVYFDYSAVLVLLTLLISIIARNLTRGKINKAFIVLTVEVLFTAAVGAVTLNLDNAGPGNVTLKYIFHTLYLMLHFSTAIFYGVYIVTLTDTWFILMKKKHFLLLMFLPSLFVLIQLIVNLFTPICFYFGPGDKYTRLPHFNIIYCTGFYNLLFTLVYLEVCKGLFSKKLFYSIFVLFPITLAAVIFEFFFPNIVIEPLCNTISLLLISYNVQRPEELCDAETSLHNMTSYTEDCHKMITNKKEVIQIFVNLTNYQTLKDTLGYTISSTIPKIVSDHLIKINAALKLNSEMYYLKNGQYRLVLEERNFSKAQNAAEEILTQLKQTHYYGETEINFIVNVCIIKCPDEINNFESLIFFGNDLSTSKYYTGNVLKGIDLFHEDYYEKLQNIDKIIERGLSNRRFSVYYQPIYSVKQKRFTSAEALLRLTDDEYGFISPEIFIPAAEKNGSIHKIDTYVLEEVCKFVASDDFKFLGLDYIEVNLSVAHCMQDNIAEQISRILKQYNILPSKINLEITETAVGQSQEKLLENLKKLVKAGMKFSLDDFGSGYSNIYRISQLPLEIVKIDKSFTDLITDERVSLILKTLVKMIKDLNIHIVVEGVETEEVLDYFTKLECDYIQGFYFSRPIPREAFIDFMHHAQEM